MADDTKDRRSAGQTAEPFAAETGTPGARTGAGQPGSKRPYATLDLKATEIKITPVSNTSASYAAAASRGSTVTKSDNTSSAETPLPLPPSAYATVDIGTSKTGASASAASAGSKATAAPPKQASASAAAQPSAQPKPETVVVKKRGGLFSHLAAGIAGGALALAGSQWALPQFGIDGPRSTASDTSSGLSERLSKLESASAAKADTAAITERLAALEKSAERIPAVVESQSRLVAETKAALASAAGDSGFAEQITRIATLEERLKALTDAGANDPNAGRLQQIAALTGKVSDLETALATQLTALRKGVAEDVDARVASVAASAEAAMSGTQRIDRDVATLKADAEAAAERIAALKVENERLTATIKLDQDEATAVRSELQALQSTAAKPNDVAAAVKPVGDKLAAIEARVTTLQTAEDERKRNSERILLSLELQNLKRALDSGEGYASELAAVAKASSGKFDLAPLEAFKNDGVPPPATLAKDFRTVANDAIDAETEPAEGGVMDRLIAGAKSVVRVRKANHDADDKSTEAIVGRMENAMKDGRFEEALTESQQLPPKAQASAKPFLDRVAARVSVDRAVASIEGQLKSSLGATPDAAPVTPQ
ncbi:MAG: hypothetical protein IKE66_03655 [Hyphomicrobium sp.]|nr:hypothetical protein [Hyphomicrobium sp.]